MTKQKKTLIISKPNLNYIKNIKTGKKYSILNNNNELNKNTIRWGIFKKLSINQLNIMLSKYNIDKDKLQDLVGFRGKKEDKKEELTYYKNIHKKALIKNESVIESRNYKTKIINDIRKFSKKGSVIDKVEIDLQKIKIEDLLKIIENHAFYTKPVLEVQEGVFITINNQNINNIIGLYNKLNVSSDLHYTVSDMATLENLFINDKIYLLRPKQPKNLFLKTGKNKKVNNGAFFKYQHKLENVDLKRYGIFSIDDKIKKIDVCFIQSLEVSGLVSQESINKLITLIECRNIPMRLIPIICEKLNIQVHITKEKYDKTTNKNTRCIIKYGEEHPIIIKIGLVDDHYFLLEKTNFTKYAINNYEDIKHIKNYHKILYKKHNGTYEKSNKNFIDSYDLVKLLIENKEKLLVNINKNQEIYKTSVHDKIEKIKNDEVINLNYDVKQNTKLEEYKPKISPFKSKKDDNEDITYSKYLRVYFDFETYRQTIDQKHIPYMVCWTSSKEKDNILFDINGKNFLKRLFNYDVENILLIAHNISYDYKFIQDYIFNLKVVMNGKNLYSATGVIYNDKGKTINIKAIDSYKMITSPLSDFNKMFNEKKEKDKTEEEKKEDELKKEIMPYRIYTEENINKGYVSIKKAVKSLIEEGKTNKDIEQFKYNIERWNCKDGKKFSIGEYSRKYCEMDVLVLKEGYEKYRQWMFNITKDRYEGEKIDVNKPIDENDENKGMDIDCYISLASFVNHYMLKCGVFDNVYKLSGITQQYIQKSVIGGRTMTNSNKKHHIKNRVSDYDCTSLYPSAMAVLEGFLKGQPKVILKENLNYEFLKQQDGYFIRIKIIKINKKREFPLLSLKTEDGIRNFTNDLENEILYIDKISLEDAIKYQDIEFNIIDGYYFNEGRNNKVKEIITHLFNTRVQFKKESNKAEVALKLMMNSSYGKTIQKPTLNDVIIIKNKDFERYLITHYDFIEHAIKCEKFYYVKVIKPINEHYNYAQVGSEILSMSKRIMNDVMCLAEDENIKLYYQDTDSIHLQENKLEQLKTAYKTKFNKELDGKEMGQFHTDFDFKGCKDIIATESVFLGKKAYIDKLEGVDIETGEIKQNYHIRLKGIPNSTISHMCKIYNINPMDLYHSLYNNKYHFFDLTNNGLKAVFKFKPDGVYYENEFTRILNFCDNDKKLNGDELEAMKTKVSKEYYELIKQ